jgi:hypothetical protein
MVKLAKNDKLWLFVMIEQINARKALMPVFMRYFEDYEAVKQRIQPKKSISATKKHEITRKISDLQKFRESP